MDRAFWRGIIENHYRLPDDYSLNELTIELLSYLDDPDPEMRDTFAYGILARWIILYGHHTPEDLRGMIDWLIPKMFEGIGEQHTDSVFLRSYATLILSLIAYRDNRVPFLEEAEVRVMLDKARHYLIAERDLRAYVPDKGWANACAHAADLLRFLCRSGYLEANDLQRVLDTIVDKLTMSTEYIYQHDEDDRLAQVVMAVLKRDALTMLELSDWTKRFLDWKTSQSTPPGFDPVYHATYQNIRNFLRSLYSQMQLAVLLPVQARDFEPELLSVMKVYSL